MTSMTFAECEAAAKARAERYSKPKTEDVARYDIVMHSGDRETVTGVLVRSSDYGGPVVIYKAGSDGVDGVRFWALGSSIKFIRRIKASDPKDGAPQ